MFRTDTSDISDAVANGTISTDELRRALEELAKEHGGGFNDAVDEFDNQIGSG